MEEKNKNVNMFTLTKGRKIYDHLWTCWLGYDYPGFKREVFLNNYLSTENKNNKTIKTMKNLFDIINENLVHIPNESDKEYRARFFNILEMISEYNENIYYKNPFKNGDFYVANAIRIDYKLLADKLFKCETTCIELNQYIDKDYYKPDIDIFGNLYLTDEIGTERQIRFRKVFIPTSKKEFFGTNNNLTIFDINKLSEQKDIIVMSCNDGPTYFDPYFKISCFMGTAMDGTHQKESSFFKGRETVKFSDLDDYLSKSVDKHFKINNSKELFINSYFEFEKLYPNFTEKFAETVKTSVEQLIEDRKFANKLIAKMKTEKTNSEKFKL